MARQDSHMFTRAIGAPSERINFLQGDTNLLSLYYEVIAYRTCDRVHLTRTLVVTSRRVSALLTCTTGTPSV
jgi:hypothetical protein